MGEWGGGRGGVHEEALWQMEKLACIPTFPPGGGLMVGGIGCLPQRTQPQGLLSRPAPGHPRPQGSPQLMLGTPWYLAVKCT